MIFVWALEQKGSRRGWDVGHEQDVLVPWVLKGEKKKKNKKDEKTKTMTMRDAGGGEKEHEDKNEDENGRKTQEEKEEVYQRYYHLYRQGELEEDIRAVGGVVVRSGYDRDNWWAVCARD